LLGSHPKEEVQRSTPNQAGSTNLFGEIWLPPGYAGINLVSPHSVSDCEDDIFPYDLYHDIIADQQ